MLFWYKQKMLTIISIQIINFPLCFPAVLNGPPMSVKKEREAELLMARREQRSGEVICIDDWIQHLPTPTHENTHTRADSVKGHLHANVNTTIPEHIHAHMHLQLTNEQTTLSITAALSQHLELQLLRAPARLWLFPPVHIPYVRIYTHTQIFDFLSFHNYLSQISLAFQTNPHTHVHPRHRHEAACMWNSFTSPAVICFFPTACTSQSTV